MFENGASRSDSEPAPEENADVRPEEERIENDLLEESLEESFPASDPSSSNRFD
jgi:hypothetical protein